MSSAQKKTLERLPSTGCRWARVNDIAATRYEALRRAFLISGCQGMNEDWVRFIALGFVGLLLSQPATDYVVKVYAAPVRRWWGRIDPKEQALLEVFRLLSAEAPLRLSDPGGHLDERRVVCPCLGLPIRAPPQSPARSFDLFQMGLIPTHRLPSGSAP